MAWLAQNWIWVLFGIAFVAMHLFGHGGHGGHGMHGSGHGDASKEKPAQAGPAQATDPAASGVPHRH